MEQIRTRDQENNWIDRPQRDHRPQKISVWHIVGGIALVGLAAVVIAALPDVKRYIRISTM
jgi:hypothetical protein